MSQIIDGRALAKEHELALTHKLLTINYKPVLVSILVGDDAGSVLYTDIKQKKAQELGIDFRVARLNEDSLVQDISDKICKLNKDNQVTGIMIQLPLPRNFTKEQSEQLVNLIEPSKDVDGLRLSSPFMAATVRGVMSLLDEAQVNLSDKTVVVVGAKGEIGSRLMKVLESKVQKLIGIDRNTQNLVELTLQADVLISSTGQPGIIKGEMVKEGAVVVDIGSEKLADGKVVGDIDFASVVLKASKITPVPGGVGPMTVISLMENVAEAAEKLA